MNDKKLTELEKFCNENTVILCGRQVIGNADTRHDGEIVSDLIKYCRQLEKDNERIELRVSNLTLSLNDLAKRHHQLEKDKQKALDCFETACGALRVIREDNAELLAALKLLIGGVDAEARVSLTTIILTKDLRVATQVYTKHKGK